MSIHTTLHSATGMPELELGADEAKAIATSYGKVAEHYPAVALPDKHAAVINFAGVMGVVYGSRLMAYRMRRSMERGVARPRPVPAAPPSPAGPVNGVDVSPARDAPGAPLRTGEIPGVGNIEFPADHPLVIGKKGVH